MNVHKKQIKIEMLVTGDAFFAYVLLDHPNN